jgi:Fe-S cluster biosynthesis and repair protein YggX
MDVREKVLLDSKVDSLCSRSCAAYLSLIRFDPRQPVPACRGSAAGVAFWAAHRLLYNICMARMVKCVKLGRELPGLDEPPFDTPLGQKIYENVSADAWRMWAEHSKMLLNEYRLQPWKPEAQQFLVEQMEAYFFGPGSELPKEYVAPKH